MIDRYNNKEAMVFSSLPYLDPANWNQHGTDHQQQQGVNISDSDSLHFMSQQQQHPHLLQQHQQHEGQALQLTTTSTGCGPGSIRPGSMVDRARLARLPLPEPGLKCPRCESTNTKFCYFNNYSLTQPRHFCKACRRYWTRGGALRSVPVGGGCRKNKRSKSSGGGGRSMSPMTTLPRRANTGGDNGGINASTTTSFSGSTGLKNLNHPLNSNLLPPSTQLPPFFPSLQNLNDYVTGDFALNMGPFSAPPVGGGSDGGEMRFEMGLGSSSSGTISRVQQQFPFLTGLDTTPSGLYNFPQQHNTDQGVHVEQSMGSIGYPGDLNSEPTVKREDHNQLGLGQTPKNLLRIDEVAGDNNGGHDQYSNWQGTATGGNEWSTTDLSALNNTSSSSTSHLI